jgi:hypothetical protein
MPKSIGLSHFRMSALAALCSATLLSACSGGPALDLATRDVDRATVQPPGTTELPLPEWKPTPAQQREAALSAFLASRQIEEVPQYRAADPDLDADGTPDLLMLLDDPNWCGSDGCSLLVFHGESDGSYSLVGRTDTTHPPIALGDNRSNGWRDLLVGVGGDTFQQGTVALQFDGEGYPGDPTLVAMLAQRSIPAEQTLFD